MKKRSWDSRSDQFLMLAVREGKLENLGTLFERHHQRLFNFFLRMTASRHLSEDLVQEVFVRLLKYSNTYRDSYSFAAWIFQIARNVQIDFYRKSSSDEVSLENEKRDYASSLPTPGQKTEDNERIQITLRALSRLPDEKREVLLLRGVHGFKFEEIAEILKSQGIGEADESKEIIALIAYLQRLGTDIKATSTTANAAK